MQVETKQNVVTGYIFQLTTTDIVVSGFSWNPDAVLVAQVNTDSYDLKSFGYGTGYVARQTSIAGRINIEQLILGTNQVTVRIRNDDSSEPTWRSVIVTAVKT